MSGTAKQSASAHWQRIATTATDTEILTALVATAGAAILPPTALIGAAAYDLKRTVLADGSVEVYAVKAGTQERVEPAKAGSVVRSASPFPAQPPGRPVEAPQSPADGPKGKPAAQTA